MGLKKQFKDFCLYMRLTKHGVKANSAVFKEYTPLILCLAAVVLASMIEYSSANLTDSGYTLSASIFSLPWFCGSAIGMSICLAHRTSALGVSPFSPKQRVVFTYLAIIIKAIVAYVLILALYIVITLLFSVLVWVFIGLTQGEWADFPFVVEESVPRAYSHYAAAFECLYSLFITFAFHAIANIKAFKHRTVISVIAFAGVIVFNCVVANVCCNAAADGAIKYFTCANLHNTVESLSCPWVLILIMALLSAAAIAASVYLTVKRLKSSAV